MDEDSDKGTDSEEETQGVETAGTLGGRKRARYMSRTAMDCASSHVVSYSLHTLTTCREGLVRAGCVLMHVCERKRDFTWF